MKDNQTLHQVLRELDLRFLYAQERAAQLPRELSRHQSIAEALHCEACEKDSPAFCDYISAALPTKEKKA